VSVGAVLHSVGVGQNWFKLASTLRGKRFGDVKTTTPFFQCAKCISDLGLAQFPGISGLLGWEQDQNWMKPWGKTLKPGPKILVQSLLPASLITFAGGQLPGMTNNFLNTSPLPSP